MLQALLPALFTNLNNNGEWQQPEWRRGASSIASGQPAMVAAALAKAGVKKAGAKKVGLKKKVATKSKAGISAAVAHLAAVRARGILLE